MNISNSSPDLRTLTRKISIHPYLSGFYSAWWKINTSKDLIKKWERSEEELETMFAANQNNEVFISLELARDIMNRIMSILDHKWKRTERDTITINPNKLLSLIVENQNIYREKYGIYFGNFDSLNKWSIPLIYVFQFYKNEIMWRIDDLQNIHGAHEKKRRFWNRRSI